MIIEKVSKLSQNSKDELVKFIDILLDRVVPLGDETELGLSEISIPKEEFKNKKIVIDNLYNLVILINDGEENKIIEMLRKDLAIESMNSASETELEKYYKSVITFRIKSIKRLKEIKSKVDEIIRIENIKNSEEKTVRIYSEEGELRLICHKCGKLISALKLIDIEGLNSNGQFFNCKKCKENTCSVSKIEDDIVIQHRFKLKDLEKKLGKK